MARAILILTLSILSQAFSILTGHDSGELAERAAEGIDRFEAASLGNLRDGQIGLQQQAHRLLQAQTTKMVTQADPRLGAKPGAQITLGNAEFDGKFLESDRPLQIGHAEVVDPAQEWRGSGRAALGVDDRCGDLGLD